MGGAVGKTGMPEGRKDPSECVHPRLERLGVQELGVWPFRVHLVVCSACGTTLTTESLRLGRPRPRRPRLP